MFIRVVFHPANPATPVKLPITVPLPAKADQAQQLALAERLGIVYPVGTGGPKQVPEPNPLPGLLRPSVQRLGCLARGRWLAAEGGKYDEPG